MMIVLKTAGIILSRSRIWFATTVKCLSGVILII
jgi:hypothetical protein